MKYSFSNEGFAALQQHLYQFDDARLSEEAAQVSNNFKQWLAQWFALSSGQEKFLASLAPSALALYSAETAFAIEHRLAIYLDKDETGKGNEEEEQGKVIWDRSSLSAKASAGSLEASGTLTFYIRYTKG